MIKNLSQERIGEMTVMSSAVIWSLFPILTILSMTGLGPITALAWTTAVSLVFFFIVAIVRRSWVNIFRKDILLPLLAIAAITGVFFYVMFYIGLQHTSAGNGAIIGTLEILFSFLFFNVWRKESISKGNIAGVLLMFIGAIIILSPNFSGLQLGDLFILIGVFIVPLGNHFQKSIRSIITSEQILFFRTLIATPVLFLLAHILGETLVIPMGNMWLVIIINGLVLFGVTKIMWIESIFRIGVTKSISLSSVSPIFTIIFAFLILGDKPTWIQIAAVPFAVAGVLLLTKANKV